MLYLLYYESANYCGYGHHAVVQAGSESEAEMLAESSMEEYFREEDYNQYVEENGSDEGGPWASLITCEELSPEHESWKYITDLNQAQFYEFVNLAQSELQI